MMALEERDGRSLAAVYFVFVTLFCSLVSGIPSDEKLFNSFNTKYGKTYRNGSEDYHKRFGIFKESLARHKQMNSYRAHPKDAYFGVTQFADLTQDEFAATVLGGRVTRPAVPARRPNVNWSNFKANATTNLLVKMIKSKYTLQGKRPPVLTAVKDQGSCGGCWAFSIVECLETQHALLTGTLYDLSTQQVMDCNNVTSDRGCKGGSLCMTLDWLKSSKEKIVLEENYPYQKRSEACKPADTKHGLVDAKNTTCGSYSGHEEEMVSLLYNHGPLLAAVDATSFQDYMGGIIQHHCTAAYDNHAVQIVGYDQTGDVPYYIIRNSWGENWGLQGYLHIKIGGNLCGIANTVGSVDTN